MRPLLLLVALALVGGWVFIRHLPEEAQAEPTYGARLQEVSSVSFDGRDLPVAALRAALTTRPGQLVDLDALTRDRVVLEEVLVGRGYLSAKVADPRVTFGAGGAVFVTFAIEQGPLYRIANVTVTGASAEDAGVVTLGAGDVADAHRIALARQALEARLRVRDTHRAVHVELRPDPERAVVTIELVAAR